jgi:ribosome biogenesis GTPase
MTQKKLTKLQQRRIANKPISGDATLSGLVVCHYGKEVDIESNLNTIIRCNLRQNLPAIAVGDNVCYEINQNQIQNQVTENTGVVTKLLPRRSLLERTSLTNFNAKHKSKPIAANLDQILIIIAPEPLPQSYLIDQFIIIAELCELKPVLVFNKFDLYQDSDNQQAKYEYGNLISVYSQLGYPILKMSAAQDNNSTELNKILAEKTSILVGQSGVGKSTITQKLVPEINIITGAISDKSLLGKHTTTTARLYHLANNANLIDAPGIREMGIAHLDRNSIEYGFIEFRSYLGQCKFKDCSHEHEPHCALKQALANHLISEIRWANYKKFAHS